MKTKSKFPLQNGEEIKITWLPPCINGKSEPSPYIGMIGTVSRVDEYGWVLLTGSSQLIVNGWQAKFIKITK